MKVKQYLFSSKMHSRCCKMNSRLETFLLFIFLLPRKGSSWIHQWYTFDFINTCLNHWRIQGKTPLSPISFIFTQLWGKCWPKIKLPPLPDLEILDPPLLLLCVLSCSPELCGLTDHLPPGYLPREADRGALLRVRLRARLGRRLLFLRRRHVHVPR